LRLAITEWKKTIIRLNSQTPDYQLKKRLANKSMIFRRAGLRIGILRTERRERAYHDPPGESRCFQAVMKMATSFKTQFFSKLHVLQGVHEIEVSVKNKRNYY
jgi:hypothetical protein